MDQGGQRSPVPPTAADAAAAASASADSRISFLTETLLLKQALLEAETADKTALSLKIEKLEVTQGLL
jgi:hypothetical protein